MQIIVQKVSIDGDKGTIVIKAGDSIIQSDVDASMAAGIRVISFDSQQLQWLNHVTGIIPSLAEKFNNYREGHSIPLPWDLGDFDDAEITEALKGNFPSIMRELEERLKRRSFDAPNESD